MMPTDSTSRRTRTVVKAAMGGRGRFAAIVDLENIAITGDGQVSQRELQVLLNAIRPHVSEMPVRVAAGVHVLGSFMELVGLQPWGLTLVKTRPDAADNALCEAAHDFIRCGVTDVVVVGGDHAYVPLAAEAHLHVVSHADHLSRALRLAATTVTYLPDLHRPIAAAG